MLKWPEGFTPQELRLWVRDVGFPMVLATALLIGLDRIVQATDKRLAGIEDLQRGQLQAMTRLADKIR